MRPSSSRKSLCGLPPSALLEFFSTLADWLRRKRQIETQTLAAGAAEPESASTANAMLAAKRNAAPRSLRLLDGCEWWQLEHSTNWSAGVPTSSDAVTINAPQSPWT